MHQNPEPTQEEHESAPEHQTDADEQQGATPDDPEPTEPPEEPIHDA